MSNETNGVEVVRFPAVKCFVVAAWGCYGDVTRVTSSHRSIAAAMKAVGPTEVVRIGHLRKGQKFVRADEQFFPVVPRPQ